jgi:hypothetical protein
VSIWFPRVLVYLERAMARRSLLWLVAAGLGLAMMGLQGRAHDHSRRAAQRAHALAQAKADEQAEAPPRDQPLCRLTILLRDAWTEQPTAGLIRITNVESNKPIQPRQQIHRGSSRGSRSTAP